MTLTSDSPASITASRALSLALGQGGGGFEVFSSLDYPALSMLSVNDYTVIFASSTGSSGASGAENDPLDLATALQRLCAGTADWLYIKDMIAPSSNIDLSGLGGAGAEGHPLVVTGFNPSAGISAANGKIILEGQNRWLWEGFKGQDGGSIIAFGASGPPSVATKYHTFRNLIGSMATGGDNVGFVSADAGNSGNVDYLGLLNNLVTGPGLSVHGNTACLYTSRVPHLRVENNELTDAPQLLYLKHVNAGSAVSGGQQVRNNWFRGSAGSVSLAMRGGILENNISDVHVSFQNGGGGDASINNTVNKNTILPGKNISFGGNGGDDSTGNTVTNNIVRRLEYNRYSARLDYTQNSDYNLVGDRFFWAGNDLLTLAQWQSLSGDDLNSAAGVPTFEGGATPSAVADYALAVGSAGLTLASNGGPVGADTDKVGVK